MKNELLEIDNCTDKKEFLLFLNGRDLSPKDVSRAVHDPNLKIHIDGEVEQNIQASYDLLQKLTSQQRVIYGVNTSVGGFVNWLVPSDSAQTLQENLIAAVSTNVGPYLDDKIVKASMIARLNSLARGCSGISIENFYKLLEMYNRGIVPCIPSKGSLGASGDLGPLGCIALVGIGKWKAKYQGEIVSGEEALKRAGIEPMKLSYKEGLSLVNGTSVMTGLASLLIEQVISLVKLYDIISCLSFEGLKILKQSFNPKAHQQKPHRGQLVTAENIWRLLKDSQMIGDEKKIEKSLQSYNASTPLATDHPIEDSYSSRCTPHIMGAIRDTLCSIKNTIQNELNSTNDNPIIISQEEEVYHSGHFHGQYISMAADQLSISLTTLSNLSDRRIDRFMDKHHSNNLPPFLCADNPGLRLGLMGGQFMATSVTAENRSLCHPVSIQSLTSTGDFQDIVSLGLVSMRRAAEIYSNTCYVVAFELLCGVQAATIRGEELLSSATKSLFHAVRQSVPYLSKDECLTNHLEILAQLIKEGKVLETIEKLHGKISL